MANGWHMESCWPRIDYRCLRQTPALGRVVQHLSRHKTWRGDLNSFSTTFLTHCSHQQPFMSRRLTHNHCWCHPELSASVSDALINLSCFTDFVLCIPPLANQTFCYQIPGVIWLAKGQDASQRCPKPLDLQPRELQAAASCTELTSRYYTDVGPWLKLLSPTLSSPAREECWTKKFAFPLLTFHPILSFNSQVINCHLFQVFYPSLMSNKS